jgi:hypothetical protein
MMNKSFDTFLILKRQANQISLLNDLFINRKKIVIVRLISFNDWDLGVDFILAGISNV